MAGELLIQSFDDRAYREILPVLEELRRTLEVSARAGVTIRCALAVQTSELERHSEARAVLERMAQNPGLRPRWFLSPRESRLALDALVYLLCFENAGACSLVDEVGPNWVVLDAAQRCLIENDGYGQMFLGSEPCGVRLEFPVDAENQYRELSRQDLERLDGGLSALSPECELCTQFPGSVQGLRQLVARVRASERLRLVYRILP